MKEIALVFTCLCFFALGGSCQIFSEWWRQKKTRLKYLRLQELALQRLSQSTREGYRTAGDGVDSIELINEEELRLHEEQYRSLREVKPAFVDCPELMSTYLLVETLSDKFKKRVIAYSNTTMLTVPEKLLIVQDMHETADDIFSRLNQLIQLATGDDLTVKDGDRWGRICKIEYDVRVVYEYGMIYLRRIDHLIELRKQQAANDAYLKNLLP